jgi:HSP20 family protein
MLTRWNDFGFDDLERSFAALDDLRQEMSRVLQRFDVDWPGELQSWSSGSTPGMSWPQVQINDEGEALRLVAEVPGFDSADLSITLEQNTLTIRGERAHEVPEGYSVHRKERGTLRFARAFALPVRVESDKVEAKLSNGLLELRMPKVQAERPRTIQVRAA